MADSCAAIAKELAALRAEVAALKKVDEEAIAERGAQKAQRRLSPEIAAVGVVATGAMGLAQTAIARILAFLGALASLKAIVAGILAAIAVIAFLMAAVASLQSRMGIVEGKVQALFRFLDEVRETATRALGKAIYAQQTAETAHQRIDTLEQFVEELQRRVSAARQVANEALATANTARTEANEATRKANLATAKADTAITEANRASGLATKALDSAGAARQLAEVAIGEANAASARANTAYQQSLTAINRADTAYSEAIAATGRANTAINKAEVAEANAKRAYSEARTATAKANGATNRANQAIAQANATAQQLPPVAGTANNANTQSAEAIRIVKDGVRTIYNPKIYEPVITNAVTRTVQAIIPISIADAKADTKRQVDAVKNSIQSQYQASTKQIQDLRDRVIQLAPTGIGTINEAKIKDIVANTPAVKSAANAIAGIQPRIRDLERDNARVIPQVRDLQRDAEANDVANQNIERKLDALIPAVTAIPAAVGTLVIPRLLTPAQVRSAAAAGTCDSAKPGGCLGNPLQGLLRGQGGLLDAINTGANVGQSALLFKIDQTTSRIDTKIGSTSIAGGLSGGIKRFMQSQIVDRVLNLVTAAAAFHNVMMLSNSIQSTFFSMLDNLFNVQQLIFDPDGASIDTRETVTKFLDSYFAKLFGVSEWTAIKAQWKAFSTIYSSAAQGFDNLRQIHNDSQELLNMARNYTAQLGNALVDEGIISEDNWEYKDPNKKIKSKGINRLDQIGRGLAAVDDSLQAIETVTATLLNITQSANEIKENVDAINKGIDDANKAAIARRAAEGEGIDLPNFSLDDLF